MVVSQFEAVIYAIGSVEGIYAFIYWKRGDLVRCYRPWLTDSQTLKDRATPFLRNQGWSSRNTILQLSNEYVHLSCLQIYSALLVACAIIGDSKSATYKRQHLANSSLLFLQKVNPVKMKVVEISQNFPMENIHRMKNRCQKLNIICTSCQVLLLSATLALASASFAPSCEECNAAAAGLLVCQFPSQYGNLAIWQSAQSGD